MQRLVLLLPWLCSGLLCWSAPSVGLHHHTGMCDASAAVALSGDLFVVANDEDNILRVYRRGEAGAPIVRLDLSRFLRVDREHPETDIEGATRMGDRIYWITSHGRNKDGKFRESRNRFFAVSVKESGGDVLLVPEGRPYRYLLRDLFAADELTPFRLIQASLRAPKEPGALNIEGLCASPDGTLWIAFRNPIPDGQALMVPMLNPGEVIAGQRARLGSPVRLDLNGYGIRDIIRDKAQYWLVAGAHGGGGTSRLVRWQGPGKQPEWIDTLSFAGFNPEALVLFPDHEDRLLALSDDGTREVGGKDCKKLNDPSQKRFRSLWMKVEGDRVTPTDR